MFQMGIEYYFVPENTKCTWQIIDVTRSDSLAFFMYLVLVIIPLIVPVIPIVVSCILSVYAMIKSIDISTEMSASNLNRQIINEKKKVTLTVIVVTLVYIIFNVPPVITVILYIIEDFNKNKMGLFKFDRYFYYNNFQEIFCVGLNSSVNPMIYLIFMPSFRKFFKQIFLMFKQNREQYQMGHSSRVSQ